MLVLGKIAGYAEVIDKGRNTNTVLLVDFSLQKLDCCCIGNSLRQRALTLARAIEVGFNLIVNETYCVRHGLEIRDGKEAGICQEPLHIAIVRDKARIVRRDIIVLDKLELIR